MEVKVMVVPLSRKEDFETLFKTMIFCCNVQRVSWFSFLVRGIETASMDTSVLFSPSQYGVRSFSPMSTDLSTL